jgi:hypothetical protein
VVNRRDAVNEVMEHTSTSVNYHKIVLSPSEEEPVHDWCEWTRQVMHDLEEAQGTEDEQPDDDEEVVGISEEAHSRGDHGLPMNERDGQVAAGSQDLGSMTRANVETIFNKGNITSNASYFPANHTVLTHLNRQHYCNRSSYTSYDRYIRPLHKYGGGNHIIRRENRGIGKLL